MFSPLRVSSCKRPVHVCCFRVGVCGYLSSTTNTHSSNIVSPLTQIRRVMQGGCTPSKQACSGSQGLEPVHPCPSGPPTSMQDAGCRDVSWSGDRPTRASPHGHAVPPRPACGGDSDSYAYGVRVILRGSHPMTCALLRSETELLSASRDSTACLKGADEGHRNWLWVAPSSRSFHRGEFPYSRQGGGSGGSLTSTSCDCACPRVPFAHRWMRWWCSQSVDAVEKGTGIETRALG